MEEKILILLKEHSNLFVSGEDISQKLKVSRTAVWKHIQRLRENGYEILSQPHLGYRLLKVPDRMLPDEIKYNLKAKLFGRKIIAYASTTSTNDVGYLLAEQSAEEGTLIISEEQTKGKGRLGREWISPPKVGLYMSLILRPDLMPVEAGKITLMSSVCITKTIRSYLGLQAQIKWPNDVYIDNEKVCGILTQMSAEQDLINFIVLGVGINVNNQQDKLPAHATSLSLKLKKKIDRIELLKKLLYELEKGYFDLGKKQFSHMIDEWRNFSLTLGHRIKIKWRENVIEGQAMDMDENGALILRDDFGFLHHILSGDVSVIR
ncbi:MAG: biotin--[acetyl-CoA-carboxylase] ligase [Candidatus Omnitrophica bacterium]|nr:biotin--[acetyl-CoA-carboxylase] ligase [Candidatus Omnitrophota bacterium]